VSSRRKRCSATRRVFQITAIAFRYAGEAKYTLRKLLALAPSGYIGSSALPQRAATWLGTLAAGAGFLLRSGL
jgi:hypothetical protein